LDDAAPGSGAEVRQIAQASGRPAAAILASCGGADHAGRGAGQVTFPSPNREHLIAIKLGKLAYQAVAEEIEGLLDAVERAAETSSLPASADTAWIDEFVASTYRHEILTERR
jgi:hypothetical protein